MGAARAFFAAGGAALPARGRRLLERRVDLAGQVLLPEAADAGQAQPPGGFAQLLARALEEGVQGDFRGYGRLLRHLGSSCVDVGASPATALTATDPGKVTIYLAPAEGVRPGGGYDDGTSATRATYSGKCPV